MSWLDALLGRVYSRGVEIHLGKGLDFKAPLRAGLDGLTRSIAVELDGLTPVSIGATDSDGFAVPIILNYDVPAADPATGSSDDTLLFTAPYTLKILDVVARADEDVIAGVGLSQQLRTAIGGGGSLLSGVLTAGLNGGRVREFIFTTPTCATGTSVYLRRSDDQIAGGVTIWAVRT